MFSHRIHDIYDKVSLGLLVDELDMCQNMHGLFLHIVPKFAIVEFQLDTLYCVVIIFNPYDVKDGAKSRVDISIYELDNHNKVVHNCRHQSKEKNE